MTIIQAEQSIPALRKPRQAPGDLLMRRWKNTAWWLSPGRQLTVRVRVLSAFRKIGKGVDAKTAYERTKDFYRMTGHPWTRGLA